MVHHTSPYHFGSILALPVNMKGLLDLPLVLIFTGCCVWQPSHAKAFVGRALTPRSFTPPWRRSTSSATELSAMKPSYLLRSVFATSRGGEVSELAMGAYEWCVNLGSPSALVAGAVIATIYENLGSGALDIDAKKDTRAVKFGKRMTRLLLLSAFAFEVLSIFTTTVTGTMLLSHTEASLDALCPEHMINPNTTPLSFLHDNFEFE